MNKKQRSWLVTTIGIGIGNWLYSVHIAHRDYNEGNVGAVLVVSVFVALWLLMDD